MARVRLIDNESYNKKCSKSLLHFTLAGDD